jgi:uncharacterized protein (DUF2147 family)
MSLHNCNLLLLKPGLGEICMACRFSFVVAILVACCSAAPAGAQTGGGAAGVWLTQAGDAKIRVSRCGVGICGAVVWLREPIDPATGKPQVDDKNPNPALARRPIIGLALFSGMRAAGPNKWAGKIYNADDGKTYASTISVAGPTTLRVEGCVGAFCGGEDWRRTSR